MKVGPDAVPVICLCKPSSQNYLNTSGIDTILPASFQTALCDKISNYIQTSEARTWESLNATENSNKYLGPDKKCS